MVWVTLLPVLCASSVAYETLRRGDGRALSFLESVDTSMLAFKALMASVVAATTVWHRDEVLAAVCGLHRCMGRMVSPAGCQRVVATAAVFAAFALLFLTLSTAAPAAFPSDLGNSFCDVFSTCVSCSMVGAFACQAAVLWALGADLRADAMRLVASAEDDDDDDWPQVEAWRLLRLRQILLHDLQASIPMGRDL